MQDVYKKMTSGSTWLRPILEGNDKLNKSGINFSSYLFYTVDCPSLWLERMWLRLTVRPTTAEEPPPRLPMTWVKPAQKMPLVPSITLVFHSQTSVIHAGFSPVCKVWTLCFLCVAPQAAGSSGSGLDLRRPRLANAASILRQEPVWLRLCATVFPSLLLYSYCLVLSCNRNKNLAVKGINKGC